MYPLVLFAGLIHLSDYEHTRGNLGILGLIIGAAFLAVATNLLAIGYGLNQAKPGWRPDAGRLLIPAFFVGIFIFVLGSSGRLQDRVMEIATVRIPHATIVLKE